MPVVLARPASRRPLEPADDGGHAAADAVLPGPRAAARAADDDVAEVLPHRRHRRGRARRPPPDVLRDARELLVRAVLQGGRDRVRDRVRPGAHEARLGSRLGHGACGRPADEARAGRGRRSTSGRRSACRRSASSRSRPPRTSGPWAARGRAAPTRRSTGTGASEHGCGEPDCAPACTRCDRFLEFWNLVFMEYELHADGTRDAAAETEHRHGARPRARRGDPPGRPLGLRDGRLPADHGVDRSRVRGRIRRLGGGDEGAPDPRRPRPRDDVPRRRRRDPVERGPRLRPAPHHPARRAAGAAHRAARRSPPVRGRRRADGRRVSGPPAAGRRDRARVAPRGGAIRRDARARAEALRGARLRRTRSRESRRSRSRRRTGSRSS